MDRWIRVEGVRRTRDRMRHTGAGPADSCVHMRGQNGPDAVLHGSRADARETPTRTAGWSKPPGAGRSAARDPVGQPGWWDGEADEYHAEHGAFLGDSRVRLGAGGLDRGRARPARGRAGCRCSRSGPARPSARAGWRAPRGRRRRARPVDGDAAHGPADRRRAHRPPAGCPSCRATRLALPLADASFDLACSAYGAVPFVADSGAVLRRGGPGAAARRPVGVLASHPVRWAFPDDPGPHGLTATTVLLRPHALRRERGRAWRPTSSTTAPWATGSGRSWRPGWCSSTSSSRSGRTATSRPGAAGRRCAGGCCPGTAIVVADRPS